VYSSLTDNHDPSAERQRTGVILLLLLMSLPSQAQVAANGPTALRIVF
jgi:hypothetical protein